MPTYEYQCEKCGHEFERDQRITDEPVKKCPSCRAARVKRLISTTSFVLKGGGWYSDLYSSGKRKPDTGERKTDTGESKTDSGEGKTANAGESKSASGSEAATSKEASPKPSSGGDAKPAAEKGGKRKATRTEAA